jgi:hypothetical protein
MSFLKKIGFMCLLVLVVTPALAQMNAAGGAATTQPQAEKPLLIVRFNKENVKYKPPLQQTVEKAISIKPDAKFDVVSLIPPSSAPDNAKALAEYNGKKVVEAMKANGISGMRITLQVKEDNTIRHNEVRIMAH